MEYFLLYVSMLAELSHLVVLHDKLKLAPFYSVQQH